MAGNVYYATSVSDSGRGGFPELKVVNMLPETEGTVEGLVLQSRKGLQNEGAVFGGGPVKALYQIDGVYSNDLFAISGQKLYSYAVGELGDIDGDGVGYLAGFEDALFANAGQSLWKYVSSTLSSIAFPDSADVLAMTVGASRIIAIRKDTGTFYWSDPLTSTIDALNFATAENSPDRLKDLLFLGDTLVLFGSETVEFWPISNVNPDLPFEPLQGRVFPIGIKDTGCATKVGSSFAWITNENQICIGEPDGIISTPTIEAKIKASTEARLFRIIMHETEYIVLKTQSESFVYSPRYQLWVEMVSYGEDNWIVNCAENDYLGSGADGRLLTWSDTYQDFGDTLLRELSMWVPLETRRTPLYNILCRVVTGIGPSYTDEPIAELRASRDGGFTWGPWKQRSLKTKGIYGSKVNWSSMGSFEFPGGLLELRTTSNTPFSFSGATVNDGY